MNETDQNKPYISYEQILSIKLKAPSENRPPRNLSRNNKYVQDLVQSIPYEKECPTVTNLPDGTEIL